MRLDEPEAWRRLGQARVARLATVGDGQPHIVPVTFVLVDRTIVIAVDHKPKTTRNLKRLANRSDGLYLQFGRGRLVGWKGDWGTIRPRPGDLF